VTVSGGIFSRKISSTLPYHNNIRLSDNWDLTRIIGGSGTLSGEDLCSTAKLKWLITSWERFKTGTFSNRERMNGSE